MDLADGLLDVFDIAAGCEANETGQKTQPWRLCREIGVPTLVRDAS